MKTDVSTFSARLRQATRLDHGEAESSEFISSLMQGERTGADYVLLLAQYRPLYAALERATARLRADADLAEIFDPALDRLAALDSDLAGLAEWAGLDSVPAVLPEALNYADRITEAGLEADPSRLVAHHYLRYLGDLSGGQAIGTLVARHYGVPAYLLKMWDFPHIPKPKVYKDRYRELMDVYADEQRGDAIVMEAVLGFQLNRQLFKALSAVSPRVVIA